MHNRRSIAHRKRASELAQLVTLPGEDKTPAATSAELREGILSCSWGETATTGIAPTTSLWFMKIKNQGLAPGSISNEDKYQLAGSSDWVSSNSAASAPA